MYGLMNRLDATMAVSRVCACLTRHQGMVRLFVLTRYRLEIFPLWMISVTLDPTMRFEWPAGFVFGLWHAAYLPI